MNTYYFIHATQGMAWIDAYDAFDLETARDIAHENHDDKEDLKVFAIPRFDAEHFAPELFC